MLPQSLLLPVLAELRDAYRILMVAGQPFSRYRILYFDTDDLALYRRHHADTGSLQGASTGICGFAGRILRGEAQDGRTTNGEKPYPHRRLVTALTGRPPTSWPMLAPPADQLPPRLWIIHAYHPGQQAAGRTRHAGPGPGIHPGSGPGGHAGHRGGRSEVPGARHGPSSPVDARCNHVRDTSFSKYCMGVTLLYPDVKHNGFKAKQRLVAASARGVAMSF